MKRKEKKRIKRAKEKFKKQREAKEDSDNAPQEIPQGKHIFRVSTSMFFVRMVRFQNLKKYFSNIRYTPKTQPVAGGVNLQR